MNLENCGTLWCYHYCHFLQNIRKKGHFSESSFITN
uniref:Uncharacterized protein n=1 Tax=Arundo donax TaxID=35708 RepID=A0A0A9CCH0_ARUDO